METLHSATAKTEQKNKKYTKQPLGRRPKQQNNVKTSRNNSRKEREREEQVNKKYKQK